MFVCTFELYCLVASAREVVATEYQSKLLISTKIISLLFPHFHFQPLKYLAGCFLCTGANNYAKTNPVMGVVHHDTSLRDPEKKN